MNETPTQETTIADAAIRVIVHQGFDVVSVRKIAQEAGVAPGTVQYYMGTKDKLLTKALTHSIFRQQDRIQNLPLPADPFDAFCRSLLELLPIGEIQREDAALWVILGAASSTRDWLAKLYQKELIEFQNQIKNIVQKQAQHEGTQLGPQEAAQIARLITAMVNGLTLDYLHAPLSNSLVEQISADLTSGLQRILVPLRTHTKAERESVSGESSGGESSGGESSGGEG